ncbi:hypothetical protein RSAG8_11232, partial [Rhizoctonia solani AG-8 WAC10335]
MIFSRFLFVALAAVGVVADSVSPENHRMIKLPFNLALLEKSHSSHDSAFEKLMGYQNQTSDAMAGPHSEREAKLVSITTGVLEVIKEYNDEFKSNFSLLDISNLAKGGEMARFGRRLYVILRSCKGTRSEALYNNIHAIGAEVDSMGSFMTEKLPELVAKLVVPAFAAYSDKIDAIEKATNVKTVAECTEYCT